MDQELQRIQRASDVTRDGRALLHNYVTASGGRPSWLPSWMYNVVSEIRQSMRTNSKNNPSKFHPDWITRARRRDHITPVLCQLHWLPVRRRVDFKLACLVRQALCGQMPTYLADDVHLVSEGNRRSLRSSSDNMCAVPCTYAQQLRRQKLWRCRSANLEQSAAWPANTWHQLQTFYKTA